LQRTHPIMLGMPQRRTPPRLSPLQPGRTRGRSGIVRVITALTVATLALGVVALVLATR
jgi:hypothetical protein